MASFRICFSVEVSGSHWNIVKSRRGSRRSRGACRPVVSLKSADNVYFFVSWRKTILGGRGWISCVKSKQLTKRLPRQKAEKPARWEALPEKLDKHLSTLPLWNLSFKRSLDAFSFWGKKGAFYCIKQCLTYFDIPLFELPSLADRFSKILDLDAQRIWERGFWEASPLAPGKKQIVALWVMCKAQRIRTSFCLGLTYALYWRQTFTKKGGGGVLRETNFLWQETLFTILAFYRLPVSTRSPCANCPTCVLLYRYTVYSAPNWFQKYYMENKLVTVFLHKVLHLASSLFPKCICTSETSLFRVSF